jgi:hypothetical protein
LRLGERHEYEGTGRGISGGGAGTGTGAAPPEGEPWPAAAAAAAKSPSLAKCPPPPARGEVGECGPASMMSEPMDPERKGMSERGRGGAPGRKRESQALGRQPAGEETGRGGVQAHG